MFLWEIQAECKRNASEMEKREGKIRTPIYIYVNLYVALIRDEDNIRFLMGSSAKYSILTFDIALQILVMELWMFLIS
jgi:hypothetical protein